MSSSPHSRAAFACLIARSNLASHVHNALSVAPSLLTSSPPLLFSPTRAANDFHTPNKVYTQGEWHSAVCIAARDQGAQLLCVQLAPGSTKSLSAPLLQLIRSAPCPVLVFPEKADFPEATSISSDDSD